MGAWASYCEPRFSGNVVHLSKVIPVNRAESAGLDASLPQAIEHVFQLSMPRHAFEGDFVVPRPFLLISRLALIGFVRLHVMEERHQDVVL
jgi:hypothetical protein